ncbi:unnamed protein product (macronuclear) [Paramecium tetraurelia]|uniref:MSP domain-containing protein n=1 Tax=Paramecium tetraurelia TaxID=5888 RepID=A0DCV5_PARTE|nr:uncharacterized protein GSPATT00015731001 [Paramecium tetraurelia]CAK80872.1 unnamed protein product [Paramecium tetraurelia]|eukprot:XP_001448269.1 hypothetical protein (macronuclear) [Paramecium tetraurelia strain d4-2]
MLFSISPQPPFQIHHRKQTTFQVINMVDHPILFRFKNDIHIRIMPSYGMISPNDRKLISVTNKTSQYDIDVQLEAINYVEDYLEMLEYSNPQLWVEKQPGVLATQTLSIRMNINTDSSSTQQSDKKQTFEEVIRQENLQTQRSQPTFSRFQEQIVHKNSLDGQESRTSNISNNNPSISPILQDASRISANMSREVKQPTFFTEAYEIPQEPNEQFQDRMDPEQSYNNEPYASGNFKCIDEEKSNHEVSGIRSQTSIIKIEQNQIISQLKFSSKQTKSRQAKTN